MTGRSHRDILRAIRRQYALDWHGIHGVDHWNRVLENGLRLAGETGARVAVVRLFALFHDSRRLNDGHDPEHGRRGAELAASLRGKLFDLSDEDFALLAFACEHHTDGFTEGDITVQTCWDVDRLDLGRVGIKPDPRKLCTEIAKRSAIIEWAHARSHEE